VRSVALLVSRAAARGAGMLNTLAAEECRRLPATGQAASSRGLDRNISGGKCLATEREGQTEAEEGEKRGWGRLLIACRGLEVGEGFDWGVGVPGEGVMSCN